MQCGKKCYIPYNLVCFKVAHHKKCILLIWFKFIELSDIDTYYLSFSSRILGVLVRYKLRRVHFGGKTLNIESMSKGLMASSKTFYRSLAQLVSRFNMKECIK